ncbi:MAG: hypothetical protein DRO13_01375 [Thermoprotei archaeon]|nr:MAG: hypothetical protein DRO13_01375 [Thermoprotei archaeon]
MRIWLTREIGFGLKGFMVEEDAIGNSSYKYLVLGKTEYSPLTYAVKTEWKDMGERKSYVTLGKLF